MKKMVEVTCCDGCGKEFGKNAELQKNYTEICVGGTDTHPQCVVQVTLMVKDRPAELCMHCLQNICLDLESRPFH